jgi:hypothetical protein
MTNVPKPSFGAPKERGVNEEQLQKMIPPTKEVGRVQRVEIDKDTK